jgi:PKD repeat protein
MRGRREGFARIMLVILLLACITIQGVEVVKAATPAVHVVDSTNARLKSVAPPNTFKMYIKVTDITSQESLYGWDIWFDFNASTLQVNSVDKGSFLQSAGTTLWDLGQLLPQVDNVNGLVVAGDVLADVVDGPPYPPVGAVGTGYLASITFQVKGNGVSLLHLDDTKLWTLVSGTLVQITPYNKFHGYFEYPAKKHDIAVTSVTASSDLVTIGDVVSINATVKNEGEVTESFKVTASYDSTAIETQTFFDLAPLAERTFLFTWNTTGAEAGIYAIQAKADLVDRNHSDVLLDFLEATIDRLDNTGYYDNDVILRSRPEASFTYSPTAPITGQLVTFNSTSSDPDGSIVSWAWDLNGDAIIEETTENTTRIYNEAKTYTVSLTVTDNDGLTDTATHDITVWAHDVAVTSVKASHMGGKTLTVMTGLPVTVTVIVKNEGDFAEKFNVTAYYDNNVIGTNTSCWENPLTSKTTRPLTFTWDTTGVSLGNYTIKAIADTVTDEISTANNELPDGTVTVALFNKVDYSVDVEGLIFHVIIESNSTVSNFQLIRADKKISFNVTGPDDTVGYCNVTIPKKLLSANATTPWLVLLDGINITDTTSIAENDTHTFFYFTYNLTTHTVEIIGATVATPIRPVAIFTPSTTNAYVGDAVTFDASNSDDPDGTIVSYKWDFDDGTPLVTETDPVTSHTYTEADTYTVTLTVTDNEDLTGNATTTMTILWIRDVAVTKISLSSNLVKIGELVSINVTAANKGNYPNPESFTVRVSYDDTVIHLWQLTAVGKIDPGTEKTLNCTWDTTDLDPGTYTIKAVASTVTNEINTTNNELIYGTVTLATPPVASFTISTNPPYYIGDTLTFNASTSQDPDGQVVSYKWNFGDETPIVIETDTTTTHVYNAAGTYTVTLTITDSQSLTDLTTHTVTVSEKHDIAIVNITPSSNKVTVGELVSINVTAVNNGTQTESFNIIVYYDNQVIGTISVTNLASGDSETPTIDWNTTEVDPATYTIKAVASTIEGEIDTTNNEFIGGTITITPQAAALDILVYVAVFGVATIIILAMAFYFLRARKHSAKA